MKALFALQPAKGRHQILAGLLLASLFSLVHPGLSKADFSLQADGNTAALVFQIKSPSKIETQSSLTIQDIIDSDPLPGLLTDYLNSYKSPLAPYAAQIIQEKNWKKALAISFVESNMGRFCADNNCSGIGVKPGHPSWRKYETKLDWFSDLNDLLDKPIYSKKYPTCRKMKGVYVQPGTETWVYGCEKIYSELTGLEDQAESLRIARINKTGPLAMAVLSNGIVSQ